MVPQLIREAKEINMIKMSTVYSGRETKCAYESKKHESKKQLCEYLITDFFVKHPDHRTVLICGNK